MDKTNDKNIGTGAGNDVSVESIIRQVLDILKQENSPEMQAIKLRIYERIAEESDVKPSRIPPPKNITELGGYYNLLTKLDDQKMQRRLIASALGLPMD